MSRPIKTGLDYYPHDTDCSTDLRLRYIEAVHGLIGYAVYHKILEQIYSDGYFITADKRWMILFSGDNKMEFERLKLIIDDCINEGLFSQDIFKKYGILTSLSIQKRYVKACDRRKEIELIQQYLCSDDINEYKNLINDSVNLIIVDIKTQSKVKESKVKESKYDFIVFWDSFHSITSKQKTDKEAAVKYWNKLSETEKGKAIEMITPYFNSLSDVKYCKKARTYLSDKNFNDEFVNKTSTAASRNIVEQQYRPGDLVPNPDWKDDW